LFLLFAFSGYEDRGYAAVVFMIGIGIAVAAHWKSRGHVLFWFAALVLAVVHAALVVLLPWPTWKLGGPQFAPFAFLDFFVTFAVFRLTVMAINRREREESALDG
jgi:hypothetical protein